MPRIRTIKPEAFASESLAKVSLAAERTFWGMTTHADDAGRLRDNAAVITGALWSLRPEHTPVHVEQHLQELAATDDLICRYVGCDGKQYLHFPTWHRHQKINRPSKPRSAACRIHEKKVVCGACGGTDCESRRTITEDSVNTHGGLSEDSVRAHGGFEEPAGQELIPESSVSPHGDLSEDSLTDLGPRTVDRGPSAPSERGDGADEDHASATAQDLVAGWLKNLEHRPPESVIGQAGSRIKTMLDEGIEPTHIRTGIELWARKGCSASALPGFVNEAMNRQPAPADEPTWTPPPFRAGQLSEWEDAPPARDPGDPPRLTVVPDPEPPMPAADALAAAKAAAHAAKHGARHTDTA